MFKYSINFKQPVILIIEVLLIFLLGIYSAKAADEVGGVTGAEFLASVPTTRYNAMGGVLDGLGNGLDGIQYNPSVLVNLERLAFQLTVSPYPNKVSHNQVAVGLPLLGGVAAVSAQLLNTGGFTYINEDLQPEETVSVYDTAATLGYSRYLWKNLSAGASVKTIYRVLGSYNAFALGTDVGAAYRFETPHFGQRPKPPKDKELEKEFLSKKKEIDNQTEKKKKEAIRKIDEIKKEIENLEKQSAELTEKIEKTEEEKRAPLNEKLEEVQNRISLLEEELQAEEEKARASIKEIEKWNEEEVLKARKVYETKIADLRYVESERKRLFSVINEPDCELEEGMINDAIDDTINKTYRYLGDRTSAYEKAMEVYEKVRQSRIAEIEEEIRTYQEQIDTEFGTKIKSLQEEIKSLKEKKQALEAEKDTSKKAEIEELGDLISRKEKELSALRNDPWLKRLRGRVAEKNKAKEEIVSDIKSKEGETQKAIEDVNNRVKRDVEEFNVLRDYLLRELKKAKLKRELDLLKAERAKRQKKAVEDYKRKEKDIYQILLSAMYRHEEKILDLRLAGLKEDYSNRRYDIEVQSQKELERLEDEFSFKQRYLTGRVSELEKSRGAAEKSKGAEDPVAKEIKELNDQLKLNEDTYKKEVAQLKDRESKLLEDEKAGFEKSLSDLKWQLKLTRLIYLQTDTPYLNTSFNVALQNFGTKVKFVEEGYPLPMTFHAGLGYAILNTENHAVKLGVQTNIPFHNIVSVGVGAEYSLFNTLFVRAGYTFGSLNRSFAAGLGAKAGVGFTEYSVDYTFQPLYDYGILHSFGLTAYF